MKTRTKYDKYLGEFIEHEGTKTDKRETVYYKMVQDLTWRFYFRFARAWLVPCSKCQNRIENNFKCECRSMRGGVTKAFVEYAYGKLLCSNCRREVLKKLYNSEEIIIGNKEYDPLMELSRRWIDDDSSTEDVTKEEYEKHTHPALRG